MLDFIRKRAIWDALDAGFLAELDRNKISFQLKTMQDLAVYSILRGERDLSIAEVGGGDSRILRRLAESNRCYNIEKFEGADQGPKSEITIPNVKNIRAFVGEFDSSIESGSFDVVFSISVVEHVKIEDLDSFHRDVIRILKPGGRFLHAIDMYIADTPTEFWQSRYQVYRSWLSDYPEIEPSGPVSNAPLAFSCSMASNPDNILHGWGALVPGLANLRTQAQNVSLLVGGTKKR